MNVKIIKIQTQDDAKQASEFLSTENAFEDFRDWNETERTHLINTPFKALNSSNSYNAWITLIDNVVIGYIDLREHDLHNGGYYTDWFAVHKNYRSKGIGTKMLLEVEDYARKLHGRYILIETGDIAIYARTRKFYENHEYKQVGHLIEYYYENWGMYIYQKLL